MEEVAGVAVTAAGEEVTGVAVTAAGEAITETLAVAALDAASAVVTLDGAVSVAIASVAAVATWSAIRV